MINTKKQYIYQKDFLDFYFKNEKEISAILYDESAQTNELNNLSEKAEQLYTDILDYLEEKLKEKHLKNVKIKRRYYTERAVFEINGFGFTFWLVGNDFLMQNCLEPKIENSNGGMIMWIWRDKTDNIDEYRKLVSSNEKKYKLNKVQFETLCKKYEQKYKKKDYPKFGNHEIIWQYFPYTTGENCKKWIDNIIKQVDAHLKKLSKLK